MIEPMIEQTDDRTPDFTDELSDEALDRAEGGSPVMLSCPAYCYGYRPGS